MKLCGAKAKSTGNPCRREAGWGTNHFGEGRCRFHGGSTPIKSGRYSVVIRESVIELIEHFERDEAPLDVLPELAQIRALLTDFINRHCDVVDALLEWNAMEELDAKREKRRPNLVQIPKLDDAIYYLKTAASIAQKEKQLELDGAVSRKTLYRVLTEMTRVVDMCVDDREITRKIRDGWLRIQLD